MLRILFLALLVPFTLLMSTSAVAAGRGGVQRMAIAPGKYSLSPGSTSRLDAFCLDLDRPAPSGKNNFSTVLSNNSHAVVKVGNKSMTLQEAINNGVIAISGGNPESPNENDFSSLTIKSLTNKEEVSLEFTEPPIIGEKNEVSPSITTNDLHQAGLVPSNNFKENQFDIQDKLWDISDQREKEQEQIVHLRELGYIIKDDGDIRASLAKAIEDFQKDHKLSANKQDDIDVDFELSRIYNQTKFLQEAWQASNNQFAVVGLEMVERPSKSFLYKLLVAGQRPLYVDTTQEIVDFLNKTAKEKSASNVYLIATTNRGSKDLDALRVSFVGSQKKIQHDLTVRVIDRGKKETPNDLLNAMLIADIYGDKKTPDAQEAKPTNLFFLPGMKLKEESNHIIKKVESGKRKGLYADRIKITLENKVDATLRFYSKSRKVLEAFIQQFLALLVGADLTRVSVASIVNQARTEVKKTLHLNDEEVIVEFDDQLGNIQIVTIIVDKPSS